MHKVVFFNSKLSNPHQCLYGKGQKSFRILSLRTPCMIVPRTSGIFRKARTTTPSIPFSSAHMQTLRIQNPRLVRQRNYHLPIESESITQYPPYLLLEIPRQHQHRIRRHRHHRLRTINRYPRPRRKTLVLQRILIMSIVFLLQ